MSPETLVVSLGTTRAALDDESPRDGREAKEVGVFTCKTADITRDYCVTV